MPTLALEIKHAIHHMFDHAGASNLSVLGDMADKDHGGAEAFGKAGQLMGGGADLADAAGGGLDRVGPDGLDRVDDHEVGLFGFHRGQDVTQRCGGGEFYRRLAETQALCAHADLCAGLFAGDVEGLEAGTRKARGGLQQERGFADTGITAYQNGAGRHETTAQNAV